MRAGGAGAGHPAGLPRWGPKRCMPAHCTKPYGPALPACRLRLISPSTATILLPSPAGVTARGKSRAGPGTYPGALAALRQLKESVTALPEDELAEGRALLHHRLQALFPPAPRVTFGAV